MPDYFRQHEKGFKYREPTISDGFFERVSLETLESEWGKYLEIIQKELFQNFEVRKVLINHLSTPVSENLPNAVLHELSNFIPDLIKLEETFQQTLVPFLAMPSVPDAQIHDKKGKNNLIEAKTLLRPDGFLETAETLRVYRNDETRKAERLNRAINANSFVEGITFFEQQMIITRYRFSRDIKMLALAAELVEFPVGLDNEGKGITSHGVQITVDDKEKTTVFLNPKKWGSRKRIKDRVYEMPIGDNLYILKERKTRRHEDTNKGGFIGGLSSDEEGEISKFFVKEETKKVGDISVGWEKAWANAIFPDGYQFVVFDSEPDLLSFQAALRILYLAIESNQTRFKNEYERVVAAMGENANFDFSSFARIKVRVMLKKAGQLIREALYRNSYTNRDATQYKFRVRTFPFGLEVIGFDFEQYQHHPEYPEPDLEIFRNRENQAYEEGGLEFYDWGDFFDKKIVTPEDEKAFLIMVKEFDKENLA